MSQEQKLGPENYDGRRDYVPPAGVPRPPKHLWLELEEAGRVAGVKYATDPRYLIAHARYMAWLADQGIREGVHGSEAPEEAF